MTETERQALPWYFSAAVVPAFDSIVGALLSLQVIHRPIKVFVEGWVLEEVQKYAVGNHRTVFGKSLYFRSLKPHFSIPSHHPQSSLPLSESRSGPRRVDWECSDLGLGLYPDLSLETKEWGWKNQRKKVSMGRSEEEILHNFGTCWKPRTVRFQCFLEIGDRNK